MKMRWSRWQLLVPAIWAALVYVMVHIMNWRGLALPTMPMSVLGTAVSFYLGFKGNSAYGRLWEARKIWGGIVNTSRTWGILARDYVKDSTADRRIHQELLYRHIAWLSALRTQLRRRKSWEHQTAFTDQVRAQFETADQSDAVLAERMKPFLSAEELEWLMARKNQASQLLAKQSERLRELHESGALDNFRHVELGRLLETMYTLQGKCERIKNFPLPRQYASATDWFVMIFVVCLPLAVEPLFSDGGTAWIGIPVSALLSWIFLIWNKVTDWSENPFEGLTNDIPMDALSRTIEIDMREMLGETDLPPGLQPKLDVLL
jgi:putative membrane protein